MGLNRFIKIAIVFELAVLLLLGTALVAVNGEGAPWNDYGFMNLWYAPIIAAIGLCVGIWGAIRQHRDGNTRFTKVVAVLTIVLGIISFLASLLYIYAASQLIGHGSVTL